LGEHADKKQSSAVGVVSGVRDLLWKDHSIIRQFTIFESNRTGGLPVDIIERFPPVLPLGLQCYMHF
jgi:hypothetical protein